MVGGEWMGLCLGVFGKRVGAVGLAGGALRTADFGGLGIMLYV